MKKVTLSRIYILWAVILLALGAQAFAQAQQDDKIFQTRARVADATTLLAGKTVIALWGVEPVADASVTHKLKARVSLENAIANRPVECEWKSRTGDQYFAQCLSGSDIDLGLFVIQQGFAVVNRQMVYNTVFETPYVQAEAAAQDAGFGIWGEQSAAVSSSEGDDGSLMILLGFGLFLAIVSVFGVIAMNIMRGFQRVTDAQNKQIDLLAQERKIKEKERGIVAVMLESEIKSNKAKIQAYLVVYEELLGSLRNTEVEPKYKQMGDIVQEQPALDRNVFDRNTDKLEMLGPHLSSELIHFYARIKSKPDYQDLEPEMAQSEVLGIVEGALENAQRLNQISGELLDRMLETPEKRLTHAGKMLEAFSFENVLKRGFAVVRDESGAVISTAKTAEAAAALDIQFANDEHITATTGKAAPPKPKRKKTPPKTDEAQSSLF